MSKVENLAGLLDANGDVKLTNLDNVVVSEADVTQHEGAITIASSQISDISSYATTTYVDNSVSNLVDSAPAALDTLNELAAALGDDANFSTTVTNSLSNKLENIVEDTTPQLGGTLDANGNDIDMGTNSITDTKVGQWDTAYGWGDHSTVGYLTSYTETDPIYTASSWYTTTNNASSWDTAYSWGDHSTQGYLTSISANSIGVTEINVSDGTEGQVLTTDGNGNLSFADASTVAALNDLTDVNTSGVTDGQVIAYDSATSTWLPSNSSSGTGTFTTYKYTATNDQTLFSGSDDASNSLNIDNTNSVLVTLNGITLENGTDFTATSSSITLTEGASLNDEINIYSFGVFDVADYTQFPFYKSSGAAANIDLTGFNSIRFFKSDGTSSNIALG